MNFFSAFSLLAAFLLPAIFTLSFANSSAAVSAAMSEKAKTTQSPLSFTTKQMQMANINVAEITTRYMDKRLYAPGEIQANGYTSYVVSSRVESVIVRRHAILGEHVEKGQAMVTLFSETVAEAQALYRIAYADWQRAKKVGNRIISDSQLLTAETNYIAAFGRLKAYGLTDKAIDLVANDHSSALGEYTLKAERSGAVLSDDFQQGQRVSAGDSIMVLTDESELWVEARLAANNQVQLIKGTQAQVVLTSSDNQSAVYQAEVIQQAHTIDPETRTRVVRLKVSNNNHQLHPGLFVDVYFSLMTKTPILAVPETALLRSADGDWVVYVKQSDGHEEHKEEKEAHTKEANMDSHVHQKQNQHEQEGNTVFTAQEVELGALYRTYSQDTKQWLSWREISGISEKSSIAFTGAFFIASQGAKSGFDPHNH